MAKRKRVEAENGDGEEQTVADVIMNLNTIPERDLKKAKQEIERIARGRVKGKSCNNAMKKLLTSDQTDEESDYDNLDHDEEEREARLIGGGSFDTAPTEEEQLYRSAKNPGDIIDSELGDFGNIFAFACMNALKEDYTGDLKYRAYEAPYPHPRDKEDFELIINWLEKNIKRPVDKLIASVSKNEDQLALFKQLTRSISLQFFEPADQRGSYNCILSGRELKAEQCVEVEMVDDPFLVEEYDSTPRIYHIHERFKNIVYSVFRLRTFVYGIGAQCIRWATEEGILYSAGAKRIPTMFLESQPNFLRKLYNDVKACRVTVEAYCKNKK